MNKNLLIRTSSKNKLHLNESATGERFILEGVFAELDVLNRNQRIYQKDEYLKHLQYLRNDIKNGETLFGELDHPEDRFEVKMKEASHRVIDLWYDPQKNVVMGKIELLNTPNGKLAQSIVEQGIPLHISSRAAGTVKPDNTVSIQQIYTYDLVCKPGFAGAVLHRVNESEGTAYTPEIRNFLTGINKIEEMNIASSYGIVNESVSVSEMSAPAILRKEARMIAENNSELDMKKIYEEMSSSLLEDENDGNDAGDNSEKDSKDDSDEDKGVKILSVRAETDDEEDGEGVDIHDVNVEHNDDSEKSDDSDDESNETVECGDQTEDDDKKTDYEKGFQAGLDAAKKAIQKTGTDGKTLVDDENDDSCNGGDCTEVNKLNKEAQKSIDSAQNILDKVDDLIADSKNKADKKKTECQNEAMILSQYPVARCMTEENLAKFESLTESQKSKVVSYLQDNNAKTVSDVNENWEKGIDYETSEPVWLKHAPKNYRELYESADASVKKSISRSAEYILFESQYDINLFWENTGLDSMMHRKVLNESFINNLPKISSDAHSENSLPYSQELIDTIVKMACEYNN